MQPKIGAAPRPPGLALAERMALGLQGTGRTLGGCAARIASLSSHRIHLGTEPPTTLMTGTTTQIMIDVADVLRRAPPEVTTAATARLRRMTASVVAFALGCAAGALLYARAGTWCFVVPPLLAFPTLFTTRSRPDGVPV